MSQNFSPSTPKLPGGTEVPASVAIVGLGAVGTGYDINLERSSNALTHSGAGFGRMSRSSWNFVTVVPVLMVRRG